MLRRLAVSIVLSGLLLLAWGAAGAATPQRAAFRVTLTGTLTKDWTLTRTVEDADCNQLTITEGHWRLGLATRRASRIVILGPARRGGPLRISPGLVRSIAGTATQTGVVRMQNVGPRCVRIVQRRNCAPQRRTFRGGIARITSPAAGKARFGRLQRAAAARSFLRVCPEEPADIRAIRTDLSLADAPLSAADAFDRGVPRFFIGGDSTQVTTIEGEYAGRVTERVRWTLNFTRLR